MNIQTTHSKLFAKITNKNYRDLFVASQINKGIPFQLRALRAARNNMTQAELAKAAETKQSVISRIESKGAANLSIQTLLKLAAAFDVALVVRFEPIDKFIDWVDKLSPVAMSPESSQKIISDIERKAIKGKGSSSGTATSLRVIKADTPTAPFQKTLTFDVPQLASRSDLDHRNLIAPKQLEGDSTAKHLRIASKG